MRPSEILNHLRRQPFLPFRLFLTDGASYEVSHPEMAAVSRQEVVIGLEPFEADVPERFAYIDPIHVVRIEPPDRATPKRPKGKRR